MKKLFLVALLAIISSYSYSQSPLALGRNQLNFGVGLSEWGVPFYIGIDHSVHRPGDHGRQLLRIDRISPREPSIQRGRLKVFIAGGLLKRPASVWILDSLRPVGFDALSHD